jgi:hypothetical protein
MGLHRVASGCTDFRARLSSSTGVDPRSREREDREKQRAFSYAAIVRD